jgi:hypothetical protein
MPDGLPEMSENSGKSASIIQILAAVLVVGAVWLHFTEHIGKLEKRIVLLEADSKALAPLSQVMRGYQPERAPSHAYEALQATGPANAPGPATDSALAWCPASEDGGQEWIELQYEKSVLAGEIRIHTNYNPGAIVRVLGGTDEGELRELWAGTAPQEPIQVIAISPPAAFTRVKLEIDTAKIPGWNEVDAVALVDGAGVLTWAHSAVSSSVWSKPAPAPR